MTANHRIKTVTFDSNAMERAVQPEKYPKDPSRADFIKIHNALKTKQIKGYFSQTYLTLEGIETCDRVDVLGGTRLTSRSTSSAKNNITISLFVEQDRKPLNNKHERAMQAVLDIGMHALRGPARFGDAFSRKDLDGTFYKPDESIDQLIQCREIINKVDADICSRGVGRAIALSLGIKYNMRDGMGEEWWLQGLKRARDDSERKQIVRAIFEWADAESIASHIGYGVDFFCTNDWGKSATGKSIFDTENRIWLARTYGVKFVTLSELAQLC